MELGFTIIHWKQNRILKSVSHEANRLWKKQNSFYRLEWWWHQFLGARKEYSSLENNITNLNWYWRPIHLIIKTLKRLETLLKDSSHKNQKRPNLDHDEFSNHKGGNKEKSIDKNPFHLFLFFALFWLEFKINILFSQE